MDGFWSSFSKWFGEKTSSPLYFTYIGFFVIWNWKFFQIIFLESETLFFTPRIEYIVSNLELHLLNITIIDWVINFVWRIGPPAFFTWLAIIYLPQLHKWALNKYLESRFERKRMFEIKRREHDEWFLKQEKERSQTLEAIASIKERQVETEKKLQETIPDEEKWELEYREFEKSTSFYKFRQIIEAVYKNRGYISNGMREYADAGSLAMADTRGLISYVSGSNHSAIELTKKGKMFARIYLDKNPI